MSATVMATHAEIERFWIETFGDRHRDVYMFDGGWDEDLYEMAQVDVTARVEIRPGEFGWQGQVPPTLAIEKLLAKDFADLYRAWARRQNPSKNLVTVTVKIGSSKASALRAWVEKHGGQVE